MFRQSQGGLLKTRDHGTVSVTMGFPEKTIRPPWSWNARKNLTSSPPIRDSSSQKVRLNRRTSHARKMTFDVPALSSSAPS